MRDGEAVIVDEFTAGDVRSSLERWTAPGHRSGKRFRFRLKLRPCSITYQNFFPFILAYRHTCTAKNGRGRIRKDPQTRDHDCSPTGCSAGLARSGLQTETAKRAVAVETAEIQAGRPVLVGTTVEKSELLSSCWSSRRFPHNLLNAGWRTWSGNRRSWLRLVGLEP